MTSLWFTILSFEPPCILVLHWYVMKVHRTKAAMSCSTQGLVRKGCSFIWKIKSMARHCSSFLMMRTLWTFLPWCLFEWLSIMLGFDNGSHWYKVIWGYLRSCHDILARCIGNVLSNSDFGEILFPKDLFLNDSRLEGQHLHVICGRLVVTRISAELENAHIFIVLVLCTHEGFKKIGGGSGCSFDCPYIGQTIGGQHWVLE